MYLRRQCYNKFWRCPGWAGGGWTSTFYDSKPDDWTDEDWQRSAARRRHWWQTRDRCQGGTLWRVRASGDPWRSWRWSRCTKCDVIALPHITRWLDPTWWRFYLGRLFGNFTPTELSYYWHDDGRPWWWWVWVPTQASPHRVADTA